VDVEGRRAVLSVGTAVRLRDGRAGLTCKRAIPTKALDKALPYIILSVHTRFESVQWWGCEGLSSKPHLNP